MMACILKFLVHRERLQCPYGICRKSWHSEITIQNRQEKQEMVAEKNVAFLGMSVVNSLLIIKKRSEDNKSLTLKQFYLAVIAGLTGASRLSPVVGKKFLRGKVPSSYTLLQRKDLIKPLVCTLQYFIWILPHRWSCETCAVGLCLSERKNCFVRYHKKDWSPEFIWKGKQCKILW